MSEQYQELGEFLKALASDTRQIIFFKVFAGGGEYTVGQVAETVKLGQSTASEHLAVLKRAGLLQSRREGKEVYYRPDSQRILATLRQLTEQISRCCPPEPEQN